MKSFILLFFTLNLLAQPPRVLVVTAHPDDETMFPVTIFKITHELNGTVDLALITDGSGGYNGLVASTYYGKNLTDSTTGRTFLPLIRKKELMCSGEVMGIRNFYFLDQIDDYYQFDPKPFLSGERWNINYINGKLDKIIAENNYDFIFCLVPDVGQHAHHKTATILALQAALRAKNKPIVLGGRSLNKDYPFKFTGLEGYKETNIDATSPVFYFDRSFGFGERNQHSYMIVADWVKACHKSQSGDMNASMHKGELETFWYFAQNGKENIKKAADLFEKLRRAGFATK
jgi:N-acetylglucosamine malate deacetylase 2